MTLAPLSPIAFLIRTASSGAGDRIGIVPGPWHPASGLAHIGTFTAVFIALQKIESKENEPVRRRVDGGAKGMEVRQAMLVLRGLSRHRAVQTDSLAWPKPRPPGDRALSSHGRGGKWL